MWQRLFLQHAKLYLEGSKAPDNEFKDFKNHVLHTRDGYWGGAPEKVRSWYNHLVEALAQQDWPTAVYCAGVLSHYYTDPMHPFHTGQSEAENNIHRAVEWSISKAYDELRTLGEIEFPNIDAELPPGPNWLAQLVCRGRGEGQRPLREADRPLRHPARRHRSAGRPRSRGQAARRRADPLRHAQFAAVLSRAIEESNMHPPDVSLAAATLAAVAQTPFKLIARRIADKEERRLVERMYDELLATGTVEKHLSEDDRTVRDLHAPRCWPSDRRSRRCRRCSPSSRASRSSPASPSAGPPQSVGGSNVVPLRSCAARAARAGGTARRGCAGADVLAEGAALPSGSRPSAPDRRNEAAAAAASPAAERYFLSLDSDVVDGPSIGPKTADRLDPLGIKTIRDLMRAEPAALAVCSTPATSRPETIADWQDQARLVCTVPGLRGTHAQLLVGAGYRSADALAGGRGRQAVRRRACLRRLQGRPARAAQRRSARHREDQGLAGGRTQRQGGVS